MINFYDCGDLVWIPDETMGCSFHTVPRYPTRISKIVEGPIYGIVTKLDYEKNLVFVRCPTPQGKEELGFNPREIRKHTKE
tara:strand:- start:265 stop:507 length:243 start_codon:yes stop_codon:yes gene_type:complete